MLLQPFSFVFSQKLLLRARLFPKYCAMLLAVKFSRPNKSHVSRFQTWGNNGGYTFLFLVYEVLRREEINFVERNVAQGKTKHL